MKPCDVKIAMDNNPDFIVKGYEFEVDGISLVVHRVGPDLGWRKYSPKGWSVTEPTTGRALPTVPRKTRRGACMAADNFVRRAGADKVRRQIRKVVARQSKP